MSILDRDYLVRDRTGSHRLEDFNELRLECESIKKICPSAFRGLTNLEGLRLNDNLIEEIDSNVFNDLHNLKWLLLNQNSITRIHSNMFEGLKSLERLALYRNKIEQIDVNSFIELGNLRRLELENNRLKRIGEKTFQGIENLEVLVVDENEIEEIDANSFIQLSNLEHLWLCKNRLTKIESNTFKGLKRLERLDLDENQIEEIDPRAFEDLVSLKWLSLEKNKIKGVERKCFEPLKNIACLEIYDNQFDSNVLSFFNKDLAPADWKVSEVERKLNEAGGFISDWHKFLEQFPAKIIEKSDSKVEFIEDELIGKTFLQKYRVEKYLSSGAFDQVYLINDDESKTQKTLKIMVKNQIALNELEILTAVNHENVVRYFDHFDLVKGQSLTYLSIITEFFEKGDLAARIALKRKFSENEILTWSFHTSKGLMYLHSNGIIHRDLRPENILLSKDCVIKIGNLSHATTLSNRVSGENTFFGISSRPYMSPELFSCSFHDQLTYSFATDIWSLGCVLYEMMFLEKAFPQGQSSNPLIPYLGESLLFTPILKRTLEKEPEKRIDSNKLYESLLVTDDLLSPNFIDLFFKLYLILESRIVIERNLNLNGL